MVAERAAVRRTRLAGWGWFCAWALIGGLSVLGLISFVVVLALAIVPLAGLGVLLAMRPNARRSAFGLLSGAGFLFLYVAYVQRDGPGTTCWHTATGSGCEEHLNPVPWLVIGLIFVVSGIVLNALFARTVLREPAQD
jgi:hypothetical protein